MGDIIFGRRYPTGGNSRRYPGGGNGPVIRSAGTHPAGSEEIARASGGDSMPVDDASAFESILARIRQSYALYFAAPEGARQGETRNLQVALSGAAAQRSPDAEVRFRRTYLVDSAGAPPSNASDAPVVTQTRRKGGVFSDDDPVDATPPQRTGASSPRSTDPEDSDQPKIRRRPAVDDPGTVRSGPVRTTPEPDNPPTATSADAPKTPASSEDASPKTGGWRRLKPGEKP
jgi:hypothetical protein